MRPLFVPPPESVFISADGDTMLGELYRAVGDTAHPTALYLRGIPATRTQGIHLAIGLQSIGWNTLLFSYRGTWGSSRAYSPSTLVADARSATTFMCKALSVDEARMAVIGLSAGAWAAAWLAAEDARYRTVVLIVPIVDPETQARAAARIPDTPEGRAARRRAELALGAEGLARHLAPIGLQSCLEAAPRLANRRVLIISGEDDQIAPPASIAPLVDALPDTQWIRVPTAGHTTIPAEWLVRAVTSWLQGEAVAL